MATKMFDPEIALVLQHEGGYTNDPKDPGGPTNFGITIYDARHYAAAYGWIVGRQVTAADMRVMPLAFADWVFQHKYWNVMSCNSLEPGVDYAVFDYGVNSGVGRAGMVLRRILGMPFTSSLITPEVVAGANAMPAAVLVKMICNERLQYLHTLSTWSHFGAGWARRVLDVQAYGLKVAQDLPSVTSPTIAPAQGRAIEPDEHARVRALQQHLTAAGFQPGAIDGDLGPQTVRAFQRSVGLDPDGNMGKLTRPVLEHALAIAVPLAADA